MRPRVGRWSHATPHIIHGDPVALIPGVRLGVYEVTALIGVGPSTSREATY